MSIKQNDDMVQLSCQSKGGARETSTFSAKYLVGCDGAKSATRSHIAKEAGISEKGQQKMHLTMFQQSTKTKLFQFYACYIQLTKNFIEDAMEDLGFKEEWLVVDVILKRPIPQLGSTDGHTVQVQTDHIMKLKAVIYRVTHLVG